MPSLVARIGPLRRATILIELSIMTTVALPDPPSFTPLLPLKPNPARKRLDSVDALRGLVMVIMALDHVRDYFTYVRFDPVDLTQTTPALFLTRWVTHFCAPTFMLLAGTSAWLAGRRRTRDELAGFLLKRGIWLVLLELTVIGFAWYFNFHFELGFRAQVMWALGMSMIALAGLIYLPRPVLLAFAVTMIAGHNLLDGITAQDAGSLAPLWSILHVPGPLPALHIYITYPLVPWIGVMAFGYLLGPVLDLPADERRQLFMRMGLAMIAAFLFLRTANFYGDPAPWSLQRDGVMTLLSYINVTKYPASLDYFLITVGPALVGLALLERLSGPVLGFLKVYGQVPLFYYVAHLYLLHLLAVAAGVLQGFPAGEMTKVWRQLPSGYGFGLPVVYLAWATVVLMLYPACKWFGTKKQAGREWWWSYL